MDDKSIIDLYFSRNEKAVFETKSKYERLCSQVAHNILACQSDIEECLNDTYVKAWNSIPPSKPESLKSYIIKLTRNTAIDMLRKRNAKKRGEAELVLDELSECVSNGDSVEDELDKKQLSSDINGFLNTLKEETCDIFVLRYWYTYPIKEISKRVGKSTTNVSVILKRTREKLKEYLAERGYEI